jgi:hypothetical protein
MTRDRHLGAAAQAAVGFIERAQDQACGGWRYQPNTFGDTSVFGWQVMALKSAQMAGLAVTSQRMEDAKKWLERTARGDRGGLFCYQPYREPTPTMTAVGLLCGQYFGVRPDEPAMIEGKDYLLQHPPESSLATVRDTYYWYYATQVIFNRGGPDWDNWNRMMRRTLLETQVKQDCGTGSWDPDKPTTDVWGVRGGRLTTTALSALTLEIYYRYLPLHQLDPGPQRQGPPPAVPPPPPDVNPIMAPPAEPPPPPVAANPAAAQPVEQPEPPAPPRGIGF